MLVAIPVAVIRLRCYPPLARELARIAGRLRGVVAFVGLARATRTPPGAALPSFGLVLVLAMVAFPAMTSASVTRGLVAASMQQASPPSSPRSPPPAPLPARDDQASRHAQTGRAAGGARPHRRLAGPGRRSGTGLDAATPCCPPGREAFVTSGGGEAFVTSGGGTAARSGPRRTAAGHRSCERSCAREHRFTLNTKYSRPGRPASARYASRRERFSLTCIDAGCARRDGVADQSLAAHRSHLCVC